MHMLSARPATHTVGCHRRTVLSLEPDAMSEWVGEKATEYTPACLCQVVEQGAN